MDEFQYSIKSKERVREHGEVYTPQKTVNDMLDLKGIKEESYRIDSKFLEPSCGNGNFIVEILRRKLETYSNKEVTQEEFDIGVLRIICSIYGVDILHDNIREAKSRMNTIIAQYYSNNEYVISSDMQKSIDYIINRNIILGNTLDNTMIQPTIGKLTYNEWEFSGKKVKRHSFKADSINIELNCNYREINYDKIFKIKDEEEIDLEL